MTPASAPRRVQGLGTTGMAAGTAVSFAVLAIVASPTLAIALLVAAVGAIAVLVDVRWAVVAIAAFTVLRIPEVGADFYGWSTLLLPLIALIGLGLAVWIRRRGTTPGQSLTTAWVAGLFVRPLLR